MKYCTVVLKISPQIKHTFKKIAILRFLPLYSWLLHYARTRRGIAQNRQLSMSS